MPSRQVAASATAFAERSGPTANRMAALVRPRAPRFRHAWLALYSIAIVGSFLLITLAQPTDRRTFTHELGSGLGIVVLVVLAMQLVLPSRLSVFAPLGADVAVRLHRRLATVVVTLTAAHVLVIVLADPARLALFRFVDAPLRAQAAISAVIALAAPVRHLGRAPANSPPIPGVARDPPRPRSARVGPCARPHRGRPPLPRCRPGARRIVRTRHRAFRLARSAAADMASAGHGSTVCRGSGGA